ncbi:RNA polymerase sigma factor [Achromobacter aegrifaciens]|uniref:RNA polymerase sigma factor n=1 Tax=Achromobacter aegrifaciens TaxID=1287736 RepID=UPI000F74AA1E|nr:RNA polymerase sigma factor [Achromobacter aegrifaciens]RSF01299.1 RNA polymerase sigma factor [Achromobacter aegrifaciens]
MRAEDEALILACIPSLRRYARGLTGDPHRADDLVQDTLERAWSRYSRWQRRGELRASNRRAEQTAPGELPDAPVRATQTDHLEVRDLDRCLQALPAEQREVLLLICVEDLSYQDTARILDVPMGTVMSRLSRAREKLGALMQARDTVSKLHRVK